jgi:predicted glycosyltransferase
LSPLGATIESFVIFQHSNGVGHLTRCTTLASALTTVSRVTMFSGGLPVAEYAPPPDIEFVQMPATRWDMAANAQPVPVDPRYTMAETDRMRSGLLVESYARIRPRVVIIDYFPFSPQRLGTTLDALLDAINKERNRPVVICSLRAYPLAKLWDADVPAGWINEQLRKNFSGVLHHADARFFPIESIGSYMQSALSDVVVWQTGFIRRPIKETRSNGPSNGLLLTVGAGSTLGARFLKAWIRAAKAGPREFFPLTAVCGPMMDPKDREALHAEQNADITVRDWIANLDEVMAASRAVVCMGGYNTLVEALSLKKPVLAFPNSELGDQAFQVNALHAQGMLLKGDQSQSDKEIGALMKKLLDFRPRHSIEFNGAQRSVEIVNGLLSAS